MEAAAVAVVSLGETHEREARLGIPPGAVSRQQRLLGTGDVALVQSDPAELVQRPPQLATQVGPQLLAGHERLTLGLVARPTQPQDLGAVDPAAPVEAADRVRLAPPLHRLGPLLGHVVLGEALQRAHELAVDDAGRERIELPGHRRHAGFVEQRQTLLDVAVQDEQPGLGNPSDGARRRVQPRTHLDGLPGPSPRAGRVAGQHPLVGADDREPRVRRRLPRPSRSRSARANQPRTGAMRAVSKSRCMATRTAAPAAATWSPACRHAAWARSHASMVTSRWPAA